MRIAREKRTINDASFVKIVARTQEVTEGLVNPLANSVIPKVRAYHHSISPLTNVNPEIYPLPPTPMPLEGVYTFPYMPPPIIPNPLIT